MKVILNRYKIIKVNHHVFKSHYFQNLASDWLLLFEASPNHLTLFCDHLKDQNLELLAVFELKMEDCDPLDLHRLIEPF